MVTGQQRLQCGGAVDHNYYAPELEYVDLQTVAKEVLRAWQQEAGGMNDAMNKLQAAVDVDDCGEDIWTGEWPGLAECREFGFWTQWIVNGKPAELHYRAQPGDVVQGWRDCEEGAPLAAEDLNRLSSACNWDRSAKRWVLRS